MKEYEVKTSKVERTRSWSIGFTGGWKPPRPKGWQWLGILLWIFLAIYWIYLLWSRHRWYDAMLLGIVFALIPPLVTGILVPWSSLGRVAASSGNLAIFWYGIAIGGALFYIFFAFGLQVELLTLKGQSPAQILFQQVVLTFLGVVLIPALLWSTPGGNQGLPG